MESVLKRAGYGYYALKKYRISCRMKHQRIARNFRNVIIATWQAHSYLRAVH